MRIAFFGTGEFSKNILEGILKDDSVDVCLVVSQPDKVVWRKRILTPTVVKEFARKKGIDVLQPERLKDNVDFAEKLESLDLDFAVVVAYWKILPGNLLDIPKYGFINIHGSILPAYRWASPIQESIKNWDKETGLTIMQMSEGMDEWNIFEIERVKIWKNDKTEDIFKKFEIIWPQLLLNTLRKIISWEKKSVIQDESKVSYCSKISKEYWEVDFKNENSDIIFNKYKSYYTWPWIYSYYNDKKINFEEIEYSDEIAPWFDIWSVIKNWKQIWIVCRDNKILILKKIKLEWKKSMDILSFVNWNKDFLDYKF